MWISFGPLTDSVAILISLSEAPLQIHIWETSSQFSPIQVSRIYQEAMAEEVPKYKPNKRPGGNPGVTQQSWHVCDKNQPALGPTHCSI